MYSYVVTAQKPTSVKHAITGNFTSPNEVNLIISKTTRLEIHTLTPEGLQPFLDIGFYGRIATMELFRPSNEERDFLFISTERYKFCVLAYDSVSGEVVTRAYGDLQDRIGKPVEHKQIGIIDPDCRAICLHLHTGLLKIIPTDPFTGKLKEAFVVRLEELNVIDIQFLSSCANPTILILFQDAKEVRHVNSYEISLEDKELKNGPLRLMSADESATSIIPVPHPYGGAIIIGEISILYLNRDTQLTISMEPTNITAHGIVDPDGSRYLLGDTRGELYILVLQHEDDAILSLKMEKLGQTSIPSTLAYLDNGVVFVGSHYGDSQLVKLLTEKTDDSYLEHLDSFLNLGPIVSFTVVDLERQGQGQVVTCSGAFKDGSLRIIRSGIGINEQASIELPGVKGIWSLKGENTDFDKYLVVSFVSQTRILAISGEEMGEAELAGIDASSQTLLCSNIKGNRVLQITEKQVRVISGQTMELLSTWNAPSTINVAAANTSQAVVSIGGGNIVYLSLSGDEITQIATKTLEHEISCLDIHPCGADPNAEAEYCAVGLWTDISVRVLRIPTLEEVTKEVLGGEFLPRSVLFVSFENIQYLLCALGDGNLFSYRFALDTNALHDRKKVSLGTQPVLLNIFQSKNVTNVFAASDRPTVIYSNNKKLLYSNVNLKNVDYMCAFNAEAFPDSLAIVGEDTLTVGNIDDIQKLHIRTIPLGETPRRISHQPSTNSFALLTINHSFNDLHQDIETHYVRLLDDQTFDIIESYKLGEYEIGSSIISIKFAADPTEYYIVGTAIARADESQCSNGRILVFQVKENRKLVVVSEQAIDGAAYCMADLSGKLIVGINNLVAVYNWSENMALDLLASCQGSVLSLSIATKGNIAVVGDLIRSVSLFQYNDYEKTLEETSRDNNPNWTTAVEIIDDENYLCVENAYNLYTVKKNTTAEFDEDRAKLDTVGQFHIGEFINKFAHGSLVMRPSDSESRIVPTIIFSTVSGALGVIASITEEEYAYLEKVQTNINKVIKGVGGLSHSEWRSFCTDRKIEEASGFIDGDLIESFLDLKPEKMEEVVAGLGIQVEDLCKVIEDLSQAIH